MCRSTLPTQSPEAAQIHSPVFQIHKCCFFNACGRSVRRKPVPLDLQLRWLTNRFIKQRVNWHRGTGVAMETDGTIASPWSGLHFLALSGGACVSASGIWVRWWTIFIQICARNPFIHLGIKRVSSWVTVKQKLAISLILWSVSDNSST